MTRYEIGDFTVDTESIEVWGPDGERSFEPQVFDVLLYLIEQRGRLVTKEELLDNVWGDRFVSESAMTTRIKQARRLLDDDGRNQWAIKTVHGRGYRFVPDVRVDTPKVPSSPALETAALPAELRVDARHLFCGRVAELAQALSVVGDDAGSSEEVTRAGDDHPIGWVWVLGEPGIGKTRLAAEIAAAVREIGHLVFFGRNNEDLRVPYQPFIEVIRSSAPHVDSERRAALAAALPVELARLLPELEAAEDPHGGARPRASTANDAGRRYELFEAMSEWLAACATDRPVTVVIDDVHWASDSTLHLIGHLQQRRQLRGCVNVVVTSRDTAPDINAVVADLFAKAQGVERSTVIRLAGLSADDARRLVGADVSLDEVLRQTAGNPLLLQAVNPVDGAVDLQGAVRRRLSRLDEDVRATLAMASVVGLEFELTLIAGTLGRDELEVLDALESAVGARLIDDVGVDRFRFTHALVRSVLRHEHTSARRARLHGRVATLLDERFPDDLRRLPELAFHTAEAAAADPLLVPLAVERLGDALLEVVELSVQQVVSSGGRLAFSTDSYVVNPMFFPGGNIGDLAVNGTVNDVAMSGAQPIALSAGFILEEGLAMSDLGMVVN